MNETNLTPRQKSLLNLINEAAGLARDEIQEKLKTAYAVSKPTIIRDLSRLIEQKLVRPQGKGKNLKYLPFQENPLLKPFDLDQYFLTEPDRRLSAKRNFDFGIFDNLNDLFSVTEREEIRQIQKSFTEETQKLSPDILRRELERFVIELAWKSSKIEGNTYTLLETESLIKESRAAEGKSRSEAVMILNHKAAFEQILKSRALFKNITASEIHQLHNVLVKNLGITTGIRMNAVGITGTAYTPPDNKFQIAEALEKLVVLLNKNESVLEKALIANAMIAYIQPYADGNKRTGRMLSNAILLANDYYPLSYRSVNEDEFKKALIIFYEQGSIFTLKRIFLEQLIFAYGTYFK